MREEDVRALRRAGHDDRAIHDAAQVVAYFNYINRVAEGLHVDLEPGMAAAPGEVQAPGTTDILFAAGEAMGSEPGDTGMLAVTWQCPRCLRVFLPGTAPPDHCDTCSTDRREFIVLDTSG